MGLNLIPFYGALLDQPLTCASDPRPKKAMQSHVLIYGAIEAHDYGDKGCIASNKTIANETGLSTSRVASIISELSNSMWIQVNLNNRGQRTSIQPLLTLAKGVYRPLPDVATPLPDVATPLARRGNREHNIDSSKEKLHTSTLRDDNPDSSLSLQASSSEGDGSKSSSETSSARAAHLEKVFNALVKILHPGQKILYTPKRKSHLNARLKNFKPSQLVEAANNLMKDPWNTGQNPQNKKYADFDFLTRSDEQVEKWLNTKTVKPQKSVF